MIVQDLMASSLSNLVNNLAEGIHKIKCKYEHDNKKCQTCGTKCKGCECCLEYTSVEYDAVRITKKVWWKLKKEICQYIQCFNHNSNKCIVAKRCLPIWIHGWLGKIQWNIITKERRFSHSPKHRRHCWCSLDAHKKSF